MGWPSRDFFTTRDLARFAWQQIAFRVGGQESREDMADAREAALAFVAGREVAEIVRLGEEIYDELMADRIWGPTRALAQQHLDAGQRVWLVTATPVELASIIARRLGLTGALGTVAEVEDGRYTGRLVGEPLHGPAKAEAVRALAEREGLDLSRCTAYSDSTNDLPMLSPVGHAGRDQPRPRPEEGRPRARAGRSATSGPRARRRGSASPPPPGSVRCAAASSPASRSAAARRSRASAATRAATSRRAAPPAGWGDAAAGDDPLAAGAQMPGLPPRGAR